MAEGTAGTEWSEREIDVILANYFDMLSLELAGRPYNKSERNAALQKLIGRSHGSIEYKHQNISAALMHLGLPWVRGYKPMANFQRALLDGIARHDPDIEARVEAEVPTSERQGFAENQPIFLEPPPSLTGAANIPGSMRRLVRKFDPAERDARNRRLGRGGEECIFFHERALLRNAGRDDLVSKVRWVSEEDGDGAGYDILSFSPDGKERLVEVKTTAGHDRTPFYLSRNEHALAEERPDVFRLVRLYDFAREPRAFELVPPLGDAVRLRPASFIASFR